MGKGDFGDRAFMQDGFQTYLHGLARIGGLLPEAW